MPDGRVVVVEDDSTMAEMVAYNLRRHGLEAEIAADGLTGLRKAKERGVSLVILDLMLPGLDGLAIARELHSSRPNLPVLMLTARGEDASKLSGFEAGVDDYVTKPFSMEELLARVKALLRRTRSGAATNEPPGEVTFGDLRISLRDHRCWVAELELDLRPKEFSLLATMASQAGRLFSRVELTERVWGFSYLGDSRTIDTHVKNVRHKIEDRSAYHYIETVRGAGYRFRVRPKAHA